MTRNIALIATIVALLAPGSQAAPAKVRTTTLKNGLTVLLAPDPLAGTVDVAVWYRAGVLNEPPRRSGLTHLVERILLGAYENPATADYQRRLRAEGTVPNTFSAPDFTSFYAVVTEQALEPVLALEAERMARPALDEQVLDIERDFVRAERRALFEGNPVARAVQTLFQTAYPGHGYARPGVGSEEDLAAIRLEEVQRDLRERFTPSNAMLTVVGRFDPDATLRTIRRLFEPLPRGAAPLAKPAAPSPPSPRGEGLVPGGVSLVAAGWRVPEDGDPSSPALEVLARALGAGSSPRLNAALAGPEKPFLEVRADFDARRAGSLLYVLGAMRADGDTAAAEQALLDEVTRLEREPLSADELERARRGVELDWLLGQQTPRGRAQALGIAQLVNGDYRAAERRLDAIRALTPADLQAAARRVLADERRTVVWMHGSASAPPSAAEGEGQP